MGKNFCWNLRRYVMLKQNTLLMEMLDYTGCQSFERKNQEAGIIFIGLIQKRIQQLIFEVYYQQAFDHLSKKSFHFMREWVLKLWILNILIHNILSGIHFPRGWKRPFGIWSKYCSNLISWMYRCNQFSFFLW